MLTAEEKKAVMRYLAHDESRSRFWWDMFPYLAPPAAFAVYGVWRGELAAVALAFSVLFLSALWYLAQQIGASIQLQSAVRKYETAVKALEKPDAH